MIIAGKERWKTGKAKDAEMGDVLLEDRRSSRKKHKTEKYDRVKA